jgi:hypothetical protein
MTSNARSGTGSLVSARRRSTPVARSTSGAERVCSASAPLRTDHQRLRRTSRQWLATMVRNQGRGSAPVRKLPSLSQALTVASCKASPPRPV